MMPLMVLDLQCILYNLAAMYIKLEPQISYQPGKNIPMLISESSISFNITVSCHCPVFVQLLDLLI